MINLLNKPLKAFIIYALIVLSISIPVYVFVIDFIWQTEIDENNLHAANRIKSSLNSNHFTDLELVQLNSIWGKLHEGLTIELVPDYSGLYNDSIYEIERVSAIEINEIDRFRGLKTCTELNGSVYKITIETNIEDTNETFATIALITAVFFVVLIVGFIVLNRFISRRLFQPFYNTLNFLKEYDLSNSSSVNLGGTNIIEFAELNSAVELLINQNVAVYKQQKQFLENASHELQTPLAIIQLKLDLLRQKTEATPELLEAIEQIQTPLTRLVRVNKNLLVLAKVENQQFNTTTTLNIHQVLNETLTLFQDFANSKSITFTVRLNTSLIVSAHPFLLETLFHNLLSNAIRHSNEQTEIKVTTTKNSVEITNAGLSQLNTNHIFQRFSSSTNQKVSSGLGLAIAKEICTKYAWQLSYSFNNNSHVFVVKFH